MILSYGRPAMTYTGLAFVDDPAILSSGRPGQVARFAWPSASGSASIVSAFDAPIAPRVAGLLNTTLPVGSTFAVTINGITYSQPIVALPRGERVCWLVLPDGLAVASGCTWTVTASVAAGSAQDIGELWIGPGLDLGIMPDWQTVSDDPTITNASELFQPFVQRRTPRRTLTFTPDSLLAQADAFGGGSRYPMDIETLLAQLDRGQQCVAIPRWTDAAGVYSPALACRTAIFGMVTKSTALKHLAGPWFGTADMTLTESPIPT